MEAHAIEPDLLCGGIYYNASAYGGCYHFHALVSLSPTRIPAGTP